MGVPVAVEDDNGVGRLQVEAEAPGAGAQQEDEELRALLVELPEQIGAVLRLGGSCNDTAVITSICGRARARCFVIEIRKRMALAWITE